MNFEFILVLSGSPGLKGRAEPTSSHTKRDRSRLFLDYFNAIANDSSDSRGESTDYLARNLKRCLVGGLTGWGGSAIAEVVKEPTNPLELLGDLSDSVAGVIRAIGSKSQFDTNLPLLVVLV